MKKRYVPIALGALFVCMFVVVVHACGKKSSDDSSGNITIPTIKP